MELNLSVSVDFILQQTVFCNITLNLIFFHDFYMYALLMYENYSLLFFFLRFEVGLRNCSECSTERHYLV